MQGLPGMPTPLILILNHLTHEINLACKLPLMTGLSVNVVEPLHSNNRERTAVQSVNVSDAYCTTYLHHHVNKSKLYTSF